VHLGCRIAGGSFAAAFAQGATVGALVEKLPIANGRCREFKWFSLCSGRRWHRPPSRYTLGSVCWLVKKCYAYVSESAYWSTRSCRLHSNLRDSLLTVCDVHTCSASRR
jgi:hypothetical protein